MIYDNSILIDSDALIGLQIKQDKHHQEAREIFGEIRQQQIRPVVTNYVITETTNLLNRRYSMTDTKRFLELASHLPLIMIDEAIHRESIQLFNQQTHTKASITDLSNVVVMRRFSIPQIFSFNKMYSQAFELENMAQNSTLS